MNLETGSAEWLDGENNLTRQISDATDRAIRSYAANPRLVDEHANLERSIAQGGYGRRQIYELIQNGADALSGTTGGKIHIILRRDALYCANEGAPIDHDGIEALLHAHLSVKRDKQIGRFGLGFKSVLGITTRPEFYSRSASFGFDADWARAKIAEVCGGHPHYPTLRLARVLSLEDAAAADATLAELLEWATTVVKVPRDASRSAWLTDDIREFPAEFMLFSSHVSTLVLEDRQSQFTRRIALDRDEEEIHLSDGDTLSTWMVFETVHEPSKAALEEAGELAGREEVPVIWAVPTSGRKRVGVFWAFFPLSDETTLSGILNAPWKTNDDRTTLMEGEFNTELIQVAAELVVSSIDRLQTPQDPAKYLDALPARGRETRCWADAILTGCTYTAAAGRAILPDQSGELRPLSKLHVHPSGLPQEVLRMWSEHPARPDDWCHSTVETRERRPRVDRLLAQEKSTCRSLGDWFDALLDASDLDTFGRALKIAAKLVQLEPGVLESVQECYLVLTEHDELVAARPDEVFLPRDLPVRSRHVWLVNEKLAGDPSVRQALIEIGIVDVDPGRVLTAMVGEVDSRWTSQDWREFWQVVRLVPQQEAVPILRVSRDQYWNAFKVRTVAGSWAQLVETLLPGSVVPHDGSRDAGVCIDTQFHEMDLGVLSDLGAVAAPTAGHGRASESIVMQYLRKCRREYMDAIPRGSARPNLDYMEFQNPSIPGPLEPLNHLGPAGKAVFCQALLNAAPSSDPWILKHATQDRYREAEYPPIQYWLVQEIGRLPTSRGARPLSECVGPKLDAFKGILPVAMIDETAAVELGLPAALSELTTAQMNSGIRACRSVEDDAVTGPFYAAAARAGIAAPAAIKCRTDRAWGLESPDTVVATSDAGAVRILIEHGTPVLKVESADDAQVLVTRWGLRSSDDAVQTRFVPVPVGPRVPLFDVFPGLEFFATDDALAGAFAAPCSEIRCETFTERGKEVRGVQFAYTEHTVFWSESSTSVELLRYIDEKFGLGLAAEDLDAVLEQRAEQEGRNRIAAIRTEATDAARLVAAIGESAILRRLPSGLVDTVAGSAEALTPETIGELACAVYGVDVLRQFREELADAGLHPPYQWAGSSAAQAFVQKLGFERAYAGFEGGRRAPLRTVEGPLVLPPLHDYQGAIVGRIRELLAADPMERRALMSLPTGAGKTRVAVQALVDAIRERALRGPVLWVAQSDELCEQAVNSWGEVWRFCGHQGVLHISRLWSQNEAQLQPDGPNVVVATIQKLERCVGKTEYVWLTDCECVVIDEAHGATTPSYTRLLKWLGIGRPGTEARCPLIGLTATPFRGHNEIETRRLVARFGRTRLDRDLGEDPYGELQAREVLAQVDHEILEGASVALAQSELDQLKSMRRVPGAVAERIAADGERNRNLLDNLASRPENWPMLVFAASVDHAQTLAALLVRRGHTAASIDANTDDGARKYYVEAFRAGEIQVLTNYGVLTQGFDAPAVRAIYVARPTFSPNVYQQMIGRGLRGPLNGGKERCLIVNVADNFEQFGEKLAFQEFEHLWRKDGE